MNLVDKRISAWTDGSTQKDYGICVMHILHLSYCRGLSYPFHVLNIYHSPTSFQSTLCSWHFNRLLWNFSCVGIFRGVLFGQYNRMAKCSSHLFECSISNINCNLFRKYKFILFFSLYFDIRYTFYLQIPETPFWLISKNRPQDARNSLKWLRGWVSDNMIEKEFQEIQRYNDQSNACVSCSKQQIDCPHPPPTMMDKMHDLFRKRTMKPFFLVLFLFVFTQLSGLPPMRPYLVLILKAYGVPVDPNWATVINTF